MSDHPDFKTRYQQQGDLLYMEFSAAPIQDDVVVEDEIVLSYDKDGSLVSIEIQNIHKWIENAKADYRAVPVAAKVNLQEELRRVKEMAEESS